MSMEIFISGAYDYIIALEFVRVGLEALWAESLAINKSPIGTLHVFDVDLQAHRRCHEYLAYKHKQHADLVALLPYLRMLPTQHLRIEVAIPFPWNSLCIGLSADFYVLVVQQSYVFWDERVIKGIQVESGVERL